MFGNGAAIGMLVHIQVLIIIQLVQKQALSAFSVAVVGTTMRTPRVCRTATTTTPTLATTLSASAWFPVQNNRSVARVQGEADLARE